jgi:hypothetical protein
MQLSDQMIGLAEDIIRQDEWRVSTRTKFEKLASVFLAGAFDDFPLLVSSKG